MSRDFGLPGEHRPANGHVQSEAFHLMRYEGKGGRREWIWNSRDGITPFCVESLDGVEMHHGNWHLDQYLPLYVPAIGTRVFIDFTEEIARPKAIEYVDRGWDRTDYPMSQHPKFAELGKDGTVEFFIKEWVSDWGGHSPHCAVVTPAMHAIFAARSKAAHP